MSEETVKPKRQRATKKVAESLPVSNVAVEEHTGNVVNEGGQKVIAGPKTKRPAPRSNVHAKQTGAIGSHAADNALRKTEIQRDSKEKDSEKVAIWSDKNIRWGTLGHLSKGYNIVTKEDADKWLSRNGIRKATPQEVASYYGK